MVNALWLYLCLSPTVGSQDLTGCDVRPGEVWPPGPAAMWRGRGLSTRTGRARQRLRAHSWRRGVQYRGPIARLSGRGEVQLELSWDTLVNGVLRDGDPVGQNGIDRCGWVPGRPDRKVFLLFFHRHSTRTWLALAA